MLFTVALAFMDFDELRGRTALFRATVLSGAGVKAAQNQTVLSLLSELLARDEACGTLQRGPAPARDVKSFLAKSAIESCMVAQIPTSFWQTVGGGKGTVLFLQISPSEAMVVVHGHALPPSVVAACEGGALDVASEVVARCKWMPLDPGPHGGPIVAVGRVREDVSL